MFFFPLHCKHIKYAARKYATLDMHRLASEFNAPPAKYAVQSARVTWRAALEAKSVRFGWVGVSFLAFHSFHSLSHYSPLHPFIGGHGIAIGDALEGGGTEQRRRGETVRPS